MSSPLRRLPRTSLLSLAEALRAGRIRAPFGGAGLVQHAPHKHLDAVRSELTRLTEQGMSHAHIATMLELLAEERAAAQRMSDRVQLVWSPPELDHVDARDTVVVVQDLFREASEEVLIVSFALDSGDKADALFAALAERMDADETLRVRIVANVHRKHQDATPAETLVRAFKAQFKEHVWPGERLPEVFYDPRSVALEGSKKAVLHAKCLVVDRRWSLLTSANFTEAAQERNIEAGVLVDDRRFAERLVRQFERLVEAGVLRVGVRGTPCQ